MARFRRLVHSLASGYLVVAATAICNLVSMPLALHFLMQGDLETGKKKFALWLLLTNVEGYFSFIDLGMSNSVSRLLIDHKDDRSGGAYGSLIKISCLVLLTQGLIIFAAGMLLSPWVTSLYKIEPGLAGDFTLLLRWQCAILGFKFLTRIFSQLLFAHQRMDLINYSQILQPGISLAAMWLAFKWSQGIYSVLWAGGSAVLFGLVIQAVQCLHLRLFPHRGAWGTASWESFKEVSLFGKDLFLIAVGAQLIMASQPIIISRTLGLEAAALWGWGTKVFTFAGQLLWKIADFAAPAISEMIVRKEHSWLRRRYQTLTMLIASLSGCGAVIFVLCNSLFVTVWSHHQFDWPESYNFYLAVWLIILAVLHCHHSFIMVTKEIGFMRYIFLIEGIVFFGLASVVSRYWGLRGIIACSILCNLLLSFAYTNYRVSRYFDFSLKQMIFEWTLPMLKILALFVPVAAAVWLAGRGMPTLPRLILNALVSLCAGGFLFLRFGLPDDFQAEVLARAPKIFNPILRRVFRQSRSK